MAKFSCSVTVTFQKASKLIDDMIYWSAIVEMRDWLLGYYKLFDNLPGDLFTLERSKGLNFSIIPSAGFIQLYEDARRRYEALD